MYVTLLNFRRSPNIFLNILPSFVIHNVLTTSHLKTRSNVIFFLYYTSCRSENAGTPTKIYLFKANCTTGITLYGIRKKSVCLSLSTQNIENVTSQSSGLKRYVLHTSATSDALRFLLFIFSENWPRFWSFIWSYTPNIQQNTLNKIYYNPEYQNSSKYNEQNLRRNKRIKGRKRPHNIEFSFYTSLKERETELSSSRNSVMSVSSGFNFFKGSGMETYTKKMSALGYLFLKCQCLANQRLGGTIKPRPA